MDKNLNSIQEDNLLQQMAEILRQLKKLEAEILQLKKRVQVLENP